MWSAVRTSVVKRNKEFDCIFQFDCRQLSGPTLFPFCSTSRQADKKAQVLLPLVVARSSNHACSAPGQKSSPQPQPPYNSKPVSFSLTFSSHFWTSLGVHPVLPRKCITQVINPFIPSWCVCGIMSGRSNQSLDGRPIWPLRSDHITKTSKVSGHTNTVRTEATSLGARLRNYTPLLLDAFDPSKSPSQASTSW